MLFKYLKHDCSFWLYAALLLQNVGPMNMVYSLSLTFGLLVLPEYTPFSHSALVQATRKDLCKYEYVKSTVLAGWILIWFLVFLHSGTYYEWSL